MSEQRFKPKATEYPGPRQQITLDISQVGLDALLVGSNVTRIWLEPQGGTYALRADGLLKETKADGVKPAITVLIDALNDFGDVLDAHHEECPEVVNQAFERLTERWVSYQGERLAPSPAAVPNPDKPPRRGVKGGSDGK